MEGKGKLYFGKMIMCLITTIPSLLRLIDTFIRLVEQETRLAGRSLISLLMLFVALGTLLLSTWLCILALLVFYFVSLKLSWLMSLLIVFVLNILLLLIVALSILAMRHNLFYPKTRQLIRNLDKK